MSNKRPRKKKKPVNKKKVLSRVTEVILIELGQRREKVWAVIKSLETEVEMITHLIDDLVDYKLIIKE